MPKEKRSTAVNQQACELMTVRKHPQASYELLMPYWWHTPKKVCALKGPNDVVLQQHVTTLCSLSRWIIESCGDCFPQRDLLNGSVASPNVPMARLFLSFKER
ncbi:hypothetical protein V8C34DRAFT_296962 [Trichoderma compactum]